MSAVTRDFQGTPRRPSWRHRYAPIIDCNIGPQSTPKVQLVAELDSRVRTLHEQDPGTRVRAPCQEGVQSGCSRCRYQLDSNKLACASSAEAARQESSPRFHLSQVDCVLPNGRKNRHFPEPSQQVSQIFKRKGPREITVGLNGNHKNKPGMDRHPRNTSCRRGNTNRTLGTARLVRGIQQVGVSRGKRPKQ